MLLVLMRSVIGGATILATLPPMHAAFAAQPYAIDQRYGTLGFEIVEGGVFTSRGVFKRFAGTVVLDFDHPENSRINVSADAASADIPGPGADAMLRSPDYFDVRTYPSVTFVSTSIVPAGANRYHILGTLVIRGIRQPQAFDAVLTEHKATPETPPVADFSVTGALLRSRFGMVADAPFISDSVRLTIDVHLALGPPAIPPPG
jgi:polyisoprenoid-binding protein YceI